ncbi:MAG TPA: DUF6064 family protein, partial [Gemmatimonadales bacterium]|nr:DUF6064 family protein [Gemmatimonadales bacterium]
NLAMWPAHILAVALGLVILLLLRVRSPARGRVSSGILVVLLGFVAWAFLWQRYATINWAVAYVLPLLVLEIVLLAWSGLVRNGLAFRASRRPAGVTGMTLLAFSVLAYPIIAPLLGRSWRHAEVFGIAPDPTVIGTAGLVLLAEGRTRWELLAVPLIWCTISSLTLLAMGSPDAVLPAVAAIGVVAAGVSSRHRRWSAPDV